MTERDNPETTARASRGARTSDELRAQTLAHSRGLRVPEGAIVFANELQGPHRPRPLHLVPQAEFVGQAIEAESRGVFHGGKHNKHASAVAVGAIAPSSAEDPLTVFPQHLEATVATKAESNG